MSFSQKDYCHLNELGTVSRGRSRHSPRNAPHLYGGKYPFIQTADISNSNLKIIEYSQTYSEAGLEQSKLWQPGILCIVNAGVNTGDNAILSFPACFPDSVIAFKANPKKCDVLFIKYYLDSIKESIRSITMGATQDNLSVSKLLSLPIPKLTLETQKKIAAILSAYDDLIEINKQRIALLEKMAEEIYREWFVRFRFPGWQNTEFEKGIPKGWEILKVKDISSFLYGYTESGCLDDSLPKFLRVKDINKSSYISWRSVPNCKIDDLNFHKYKLSVNDIVIARMADPGKVAIIEHENVNAVFASYLIKIKYKKNKITPYYLYYTMRSDTYSQYFSNANSGSTRESINAQAIGNTHLLLPFFDLMELFEANISSLRKQIIYLDLAIENLEKTKNALLPRLISGKLSVENLDIEFPPSMQ